MTRISTIINNSINKRLVCLVCTRLLDAEGGGDQARELRGCSGGR